MTILYVTQQGATISRNDGLIIVSKAKEVIEKIPACKLEQIVAFGAVHLTPAVLAFCCSEGIDVAFLSSNGKYRGRLHTELSQTPALRQKQYAQANNPDFRLANATAIIYGKVQNMLTMIQKQQRMNQLSKQKSIRELTQVLDRLTTVKAIDSLLGYEGTASASYFQVFREALKYDLGFRTRAYHPSTDPVNALLSLGYTLLYNNFFAAITLVGLDPFIGCLHQPRAGHAALASDLMEEFRCTVVDSLVLTLINKNIIVATDFSANASRSLQLSPIALKKFLSFYNNEINQRVYYAPMQINTSYKQIFELQVRHFHQVIAEKELIYKPFLVK